MILSTPPIVALDSSTLGKVSRDYWSVDESLRKKARLFIADIKDLGVFIAFTLTHVLELLAHENQQVTEDRLCFLRSLPFISWLRPFDRQWFPGGVLDILRREVQAFISEPLEEWKNTIAKIRTDLWETGLGCEMFVDNEELWSRLRQESFRSIENRQYIVSVARTDPGNMMNMKLKDALRLPIRPKEERAHYIKRFASTMSNQMQSHGDKRIDYADEASIKFAEESLERVNQIEKMPGAVIGRIFHLDEIPPELISPEMTIGELGQIGIYRKQLQVIGRGLQPPVKLTITDIPPGSLPSNYLEQRLFSMQQRALRVSGSDLGDADLAPLVLYADAIEVDKRTHAFLTTIQRREPKIGSLMHRFFRCADYSQIPRLLND